MNLLHTLTVILRAAQWYFILKVLKFFKVWNVDQINSTIRLDEKHQRCFQVLRQEYSSYKKINEFNYHKFQKFKHEVWESLHSCLNWTMCCRVCIWTMAKICEDNFFCLKIGTRLLSEPLHMVVCSAMCMVCVLLWFCISSHFLITQRSESNEFIF